MHVICSIAGDGTLSHWHHADEIDDATEFIRDALRDLKLPGPGHYVVVGGLVGDAWIGQAFTVMRDRHGHLFAIEGLRDAHSRRRLYAV